MNSNTPVTAYMDMPVLRFYDTWQAICSVHEKRAEAMRAQRAKTGRR